MRRAIWLCLGLAWSTTLWAQGPGVQDLSNDEAELQRIERTRARETAAYDAEEAACYQRFAVSGCVTAVQSQRRAMQANLRRQEAVVHERQFAEQGAKQLRLGAEKAQERQLRQADQQGNPVADRLEDKLQEQQEKRTEHAARAQSPVASAASGGPTVPTATGLTPFEQASNRERYARKLADAEKKRQDVAKRLADKAGKPAAPLPLPN